MTSIVVKNRFFHIFLVKLGAKFNFFHRLPQVHIVQNLAFSQMGHVHACTTQFATTGLADIITGVSQMQRLTSFSKNFIRCFFSRIYRYGRFKIQYSRNRFSSQRFSVFFQRFDEFSSNVNSPSHLVSVRISRWRLKKKSHRIITRA